MIKLGLLTWKEYLGLSRWALYPIINVFMREEGGDCIRKRRKQCEYRGRDWSDVAPSLRLPAATRSSKEQETNFPLGPLDDTQPCGHLDFGLVILILDSWPPDV